jgi:hypothetical protein
VLLLACFLLAVISVPVFGGRLERLAGHRFARPWALGVALAVQILIISVIPHGSPALLAAAHLASYALAAVFLVANRKVSGLWLLALGTALNAAAIAANGGVMPASPTALRAAGLAVDNAEFVNSGALADPRLAFLGDVFAVPEPFPLANVFSIGDVLVVLGAAVVLHQICESRLAPRRTGRSSHGNRHRSVGSDGSERRIATAGSVGSERR